ncbi:MAG: hypothetical protein GY703_05765 [Gammaproteobacteria bacterium]|nr:hypothetical protein [Gammaproteobacteria bacterium]
MLVINIAPKNKHSAIVRVQSLEQLKSLQGPRKILPNDLRLGQAPYKEEIPRLVHGILQKGYGLFSLTETDFTEG